MIWFYRLLFLPGLLVALPYYLLRMWRRGGYGKSFQHRLGRFHRLAPREPEKHRIWLQAVSVGEVLAVHPLIEALQQDPSVEIVLTTTTSTGYAEARKRYTKVVHSIGVFPLDFWLFSRMAWQRIQPDAVILTESELWPEHLHQAKQHLVPAFLVNARISDSSFQRYRAVVPLARRLLTKFRAVYAASELDAGRLVELGCSADLIRSSGSIKFDVPISETYSAAKIEVLRRSLGFGQKGAFVLLGASTWPGEEAALLQTQRALIAAGVDCRLLLVPRHAERAGELIPLLKRQDLSWHRRSTGSTPPPDLAIHLADTTGELSQLTHAADVAFIGKSLPPNQGGQTPIEAAGLGVPILMGPHMNNFKELAQSLLQTGAAKRVADAEALTEHALRLAQNENARVSMHKAALIWHRANRGSSQRIAEHLLGCLDERTR